jgi:hypothetical protein
LINHGFMQDYRDVGINMQMKDLMKKR